MCMCVCKHNCLWFFLSGPFGYQCEYNKTPAKKTKCQNNNDDGTMEAPSNPIAIYQQSWLAFRISNNTKKMSTKYIYICVAGNIQLIQKRTLRTTKETKKGEHTIVPSFRYSGKRVFIYVS